ncbi:hypothetical protein BDN67DRAFT_1007902 [Paxillus ammoniavirescens]|nr:hypothetical protein BDN67DRAFT_1007902 [Paxillus ammoniavirescens]
MAPERRPARGDQFSQRFPPQLGQGVARDLEPDPNKPVYRGKTPLKPSDIVYVKQTPDAVEFPGVHQGDRSHLGYHDPYYDILETFPSPPAPPPVPPRSPLRTTSLNKRDATPYVVEATVKYAPAGRVRTVQRSSSVACFSRPTAAVYPALSGKPPSVRQRREFPIHGAVAIPEPPIEDKLPFISNNAILGSHTPRQAERMRAQSQSQATHLAPWIEAKPPPTVPRPPPLSAPVLIPELAAGGLTVTTQWTTWNGREPASGSPSPPYLPPYINIQQEAGCRV